MQESQEAIGEWIDTTFPGTDPESPRKSLRALEEMVELCAASGATFNEIVETATRTSHQSQQFGQFADHRRKQPAKIPAEAADVLIVLYGVAHMRGFDLHAEVEKKMAINRGRRWKADGDGTGYHIRETPPTEA